MPVRFLESSLWSGNGLAFGRPLETKQPRGTYLAELSTPLVGPTIECNRKIIIQFWVCVFSKWHLVCLGFILDAGPVARYKVEEIVC